MHQVDLFEDIAIAYGYENLVPEIPNITTTGEENKFEVFKQRIANMLAGLGLVELNTYNMTNKDNQCKRMKINIDLIEVSNAVNIDYSYTRAWVIPTLLEVLSRNKHNEYPQNVFDVGTIFKKNPKTETGIEENDRLAVAVCDNDADYTRIKQVLDYLLRMLDAEYKIEETEHSSFIKGRAARISVKRKDVAYIGEIAPEVLKNWDLVVPVAAFELNLTELFELIK
jgi:phenylalanyl-tRNA synthetase beta chain